MFSIFFELLYKGRFVTDEQMQKFDELEEQKKDMIKRQKIFLVEKIKTDFKR